MERNIVETEVRLIACLVTSWDRVISVIEQKEFKPEYFLFEPTRKVWDAIMERVNNKESVDIAWLVNLEVVKTTALADLLPKIITDILSPQYEAASCINAMKANFIRSTSKSIIRNVNETLPGDDPESALSELIAQATELKEKVTHRERSDVVDDIIKSLDRGIEVSTGYSDLDWLIKGIERGRLSLIGGYTHHGKTMFSLNIARNVMNQGHSVTIFSTEMGEEALVRRFATMESGVNPSVHRILSTEQKQQYVQGLLKVEDYKMKVYNIVSLSEMRLEIQKCQSLLYIVDYLQQVDPGVKKKNRVAELGYIIQELYNMAKRYNVHILLTSQFHRPADKSLKGMTPSLFSFRDSGEIEETTDYGMLLFYPYVHASKHEREEMERAGEANILHLSVQKNRMHGLTGHLDLHIDKNSMRISEVEELPW